MNGDRISFSGFLEGKELQFIVRRRSVTWNWIHLIKSMYVDQVVIGVM
jgi:hypothetical protein